MKTVNYKNVRHRPSIHFMTSLIMFCFLVVLMGTSATGCKQKKEVTVDAGKLSDSSYLAQEDLIEPFATGISIHNVYPAFLTDELRSLKKGGLQVMKKDNIWKSLDFPAGNKIGPVQCLAFQEGTKKDNLWVGTSFDGVYVLDFPSLSISEHFTLESTGIRGRAISLSKDKLVFKPSEKIGKAEIKELSSLVERGLYLKLNTEFFHVRSMDWPEFTVYTYGSHDPVHAGRSGASGMDKVTLITGLADNTINDILVDGDTVWLAAGKLGDKGLAGGITSYRNGEFSSRHPNSLFNELSRFNFQRSNAGYSLCKQGSRLWSGWAEIRGPKPWGGVSGNLLNFTGSGLYRHQWQDYTTPSCINTRNFNGTKHITISDLAPLNLKEGETIEECVVAGSFGLNAVVRMGIWGRRSLAGGLRIICPGGLKGVVFKKYGKDQRPVFGSPPSNTVFAVDTLHEESGDSIYAFAGTDAGLYVAELTSRIPEYFYQAPKNPSPILMVGSNYNQGIYRAGELLHGMTVGTESWPSCLPDLIVKDVRIMPDSDKNDLQLWAATYGGLAFYEGPLDSMTDCSRWSEFYYNEKNGNMQAGLDSGEMESRLEGLAAVSSVLPVKTGGHDYIFAGINKETFLIAHTGALKRALQETAKKYPHSPVENLRLHRSAFHENLLERNALSDASAINLYTPEFHEKQCTIAKPSCLLDDQDLNWNHFDEMMDRIVKENMGPTICLSRIPLLIYRDLVPQEGPCSPPDYRNPDCSPSRTEWDFSKWENLVFTMVDHLYKRYGREKVSRWTLEILNEPAIKLEWSWNETWASDYALFYKHSSEAVKACNREWDKKRPHTKGMNIKLAGPSWHGDPLLPDKRLARAIKKLKQEKQEPDIFSIHIYPFKRMSMGPYYAKAREYMREQGLSAPVYITEYNPVMMQSHDGISTLAAGELSAIFLLRSLFDFYKHDRPPRMMHFLDLQSIILGARSNLTGLFSYMGADDWAPRPIFNAMTLAAQAGTIEVPVKTDGRPYSFARYNPRNGKIMIFIIDTHIRKLWQKTKNYNDPEKTAFDFHIRGLPSPPYRVREFKIDSGHNNYLTAHWKAGSPGAPSPETAEEIKQESTLEPLQVQHTNLPAVISGSSIHKTLTMEKESIYTIELSPSPVLGEATATIHDLQLSSNEKGNVTAKWRVKDRFYEKTYHRALHSWRKIESKKAGEVNKSTHKAGCSVTTVFNGDTINVRLDKSPETGNLSLEFILPGTASLKAKDNNLELSSWDGKTLACAGNSLEEIHILFGDTKGVLIYKKLSPVNKEGTLHYVPVGYEKPVSSYGPYPAIRPERPVVCVDKWDNVHVAWIERSPQDYAPEAKNAVVYTCLRN